MDEVFAFLRGSLAVRDKIEIRRAYAPALDTGGFTALGDDCAAIPDENGGYLLLAAEGLLQSFVDDDPWFAGYSAVMVNISDVCAMGGRPTAIVNVLWSPDYEPTQPVWEGMQAAAKAYRVPIVGGHTTLTHQADDSVYLAAAILGRASTLMTSFDAQPGDELLMVVDLNGAYRRDKPFWNASLTTPPSKLREDIELLPQIAERGWSRAAKDISNGGIIGTLIMLLECSGVGAEIDLEALPMPEGADLEKWLLSFPSFGFLLSVAPHNRADVIEHFSRRDIACRFVGEVTEGTTLELRLGNESRAFWRAEARTEGECLKSISTSSGRTEK